MLDAIARIQEYTSNLTEEAFASDGLVLDAVAHNLTVIAEAAQQIPPEVGARYPELPLGEMGELRNLVYHGAGAVNPELLWSTVREDLPGLVPTLEAMVAPEG
jgi:uncharacterized protein with HEPN domain